MRTLSPQMNQAFSSFFFHLSCYKVQVLCCSDPPPSRFSFLFAWFALGISLFYNVVYACSAQPLAWHLLYCYMTGPLMVSSCISQIKVYNLLAPWDYLEYFVALMPACWQQPSTRFCNLLLGITLKYWEVFLNYRICSGIWCMYFTFLLNWLREVLGSSQDIKPFILS